MFTHIFKEVFLTPFGSHPPNFSVSAHHQSAQEVYVTCARCLPSVGLIKSFMSSLKKTAKRCESHKIGHCLLIVWGATEFFWLVVYLPLWKIMEFVSDDDIPYRWKVIIHSCSSHHQPVLGRQVPSRNRTNSAATTPGSKALARRCWLPLETSALGFETKPLGGFAQQERDLKWLQKHKIVLVGGFNPEKYESQIGSSSQLLGKIKNVWNH
jgi:hypothetical protein